PAAPSSSPCRGRRTARRQAPRRRRRREREPAASYVRLFVSIFGRIHLRGGRPAHDLEDGDRLRLALDDDVAERTKLVSADEVRFRSLADDNPRAVLLV